MRPRHSWAKRAPSVPSAGTIRGCASFHPCTLVCLCIVVPQQVCGLQRTRPIRRLRQHLGLPGGRDAGVWQNVEHAALLASPGFCMGALGSNCARFRVLLNLRLRFVLLRFCVARLSARGRFGNSLQLVRHGCPGILPNLRPFRVMHASGFVGVSRECLACFACLHVDPSACLSYSGWVGWDPSTSRGRSICGRVDG